jgi:hypothetical protein
MLQFRMARNRVIIVRGEDEEHKGMSLKKTGLLKAIL